MPGSTEPQRDPIISPSSGVNPIVESIAANSFAEPRIRAGINIGGGRERGMKRGIENSHLFRLGAEGALGGVYRGQYQAIVRGRDRGLLRDSCANFGCHFGALVKAAAVHDSMSN